MFAPSCCNRSPSLANLSCLASYQFLLLRSQETLSVTYSAKRHSPLPGRGSGHLQDYRMQHPFVWQAASWTSSFSITTLGKSAFPAPEGLSTLIQANLSSALYPFTLTAFPSPLPLFSPDISLLLLSPSSLSSPASVLPFWGSGHHTATVSLLSVCKTCSLWPAMAHLDGRLRWERLASHLADLGLAGCCWPEIYESNRGSNLISCSGQKSDHPNILAFIFLLPRSLVGME